MPNNATPEATPETVDRRPRVDPWIDPGWLYVVAGLAIIGATVLIPAAQDLSHARWMRDRALIVEGHRKSRLQRHEEYLQALERGDHTLATALVASQLNLIPADRLPVPLANNATNHGGLDDTSVFPTLEPEPVVIPEERRTGSMLERLTTGETTRLWLIGGGAASILFGLLPQTRRRS